MKLKITITCERSEKWYQFLHNGVRKFWKDLLQDAIKEEIKHRCKNVKIKIEEVK